jgi:hypothetical protein
MAVTAKIDFMEAAIRNTMARDLGQSKVSVATQGGTCQPTFQALRRPEAQPIGSAKGLPEEGQPRSHPMHRLALIAAPFLALTGFLTPACAADLDGPVYRERDVAIERPAPPVVRERIIERNYYYEPSHPVQAYAPTYYRAYAPTYYYDAPRVYAGYGYDDGYRWAHRRAFFAARPHWWHHRYWRY